MALSNDVWFLVLSRMPAKSICKIQRTCRSFSQFLTETYFQLEQADNSLQKDDPCIIIQKNSFQQFSEKVEIYPLLGEEFCCGMPKDFLKSLESSARILASSNGLFLCRTVQENPTKLFLCNPVTRSYLPIPSPEYLKTLSFEANINVVFECNASHDSDDYKIILFESPEGWSSNFGCEIFLPKEGRWKLGKSFFQGSRNMRFDKPVYLNGFCYFISDCFPYFTKTSPYYRPYIIAYNIEGGLSKMLRAPKEVRRGSHDKTCSMSIFKWGKAGSSKQSLCLVRLRKGVFTSWVLRDYESSVWVRVLKIRVKAMGVKEIDFNGTDFIVMNGDSLVFTTERKLYRYGLKGKRRGQFDEICKHDCDGYNVLTAYFDTLRPCGNGAVYLSSYSTEADCGANLGERTRNFMCKVFLPLLLCFFVVRFLYW